MLTDRQQERLESVGIGFAIGLHTIFTVYRLVQGRKGSAGVHFSMTVVEILAALREGEE